MSIGSVLTVIFAAIAAAITSVVEPALLWKALNFGIVAGLLSSLILLFDWLVVVARGKGVLGVTHGWWRTPLMAVIWFFGGFMAGGAGALLRMYEATLQAAFLAALTWQTFLTQAQSVVQRQREDTQK
jgi:hypothetical protein